MIFYYYHHYRHHLPSSPFSSLPSLSSAEEAAAAAAAALSFPYPKQGTGRLTLLQPNFQLKLCLRTLNNPAIHKKDPLVCFLPDGILKIAIITVIICFKLFFCLATIPPNTNLCHFSQFCPVFLRITTHDTSNQYLETEVQQMQSLK